MELHTSDSRSEQMNKSIKDMNIKVYSQKFSLVKTNISLTLSALLEIQCYCSKGI